MKLILKHLTRTDQREFLSNLLKYFLPNLKFGGKEDILDKILDEVNED